MLYSETDSDELCNVRILLEELPLLKVSTLSVCCALDDLDLFNGLADLLAQSDIVLDEIPIEDVVLEGAREG
jgi:hypothetical protein